MYFSSILDILGYEERIWLREFPILLALSSPFPCWFWKKKVFSGKPVDKGGWALLLHYPCLWLWAQPRDSDVSQLESDHERDVLNLN